MPGPDFPPHPLQGVPAGSRIERLERFAVPIPVLPGLECVAGKGKRAGASPEGIYTAPTGAAAEQALDVIEASELGEHYPAVVRTWRSAWPEFMPCLAFPPAMRTVVYSTNMVESINSKACDANHVAAHWKETLNQFSIFFEDRLSIQ
ncbi:transposase [Streptomyces vinaceus]